MLLKFFLTCNKIGAFTFGGGYVMIPAMEREFVEKNQWISKEEFMDVMVVAQSTPGIFSLNFATHIGYEKKGIWGAIVGALGIAFPSIIAIILIAIFFQNFKENFYVNQFFYGIRPAAVALIAVPCFNMAKATRIHWGNVWIPLVSCMLIWAMGISPIWVILIAGISGYIWGKYNKKQ